MVLKIAELFVVSPDEIIERDALLLSELQILFPKDYPSDPDKLKKDINAFLGTLTMRDASVFVRKYYFFETPAEISELYGIKEDYVRTVLMRTRRKLKKYLKEAV